MIVLARDESDASTHPSGTLIEVDPPTVLVREHSLDASTVPGRTALESDPPTVLVRDGGGEASTTRLAAPDPPTAPRRLPSAPPAKSREIVAESDPPTACVRRDGYVDLPPGSVVGDTYEVSAKLGAGAMGEVYAARHLQLGKRVAIKVIGPRLSEDAAAIERFAQEARSLARVQHPAIVAVDHVGELADGRAYFVMEFLGGESLHARLQRGRVPLPEAIWILDQMARGLEAAHAQGVTHRDLKPENTFLVDLPGEAPMVKLLDFGLAKLAADVDRRAERTQSGVAIGTPMYMSPEQARGPDVDHRTDVYALGCVAYEVLLGQPPFPHARTVPELYAAHLHEHPPLPRSIWAEIPPQLDLVLFAMLAKDPEYRPTLSQVRAVLAGVAAGPQRPARAATEVVGPRSGNATRTRGAAIVVAALIGGVVIGAVIASSARDRAPRPALAIQPEAATPPPAPPPAAQAVAEPRPVSEPGGAPTSETRVPADHDASSPHPDSRGSRRRDGRAAPPAPVPPDASTEIVEPSDAALVDAATATTPPDASSLPIPDARVLPPRPAKPPPRPMKPPKAAPKSIDKNQIVNPFARKRATVTP